MDYITQLRATIRHFAIEEKGIFLILSEDPLFHSVLHNAFTKEVSLPKYCIQPHKDIDTLVNESATRASRNEYIFVIMEKELRGESLNQYIPRIKKNAPLSKILILTKEIKRDEMTLLFDLGIDNAVVKPLSSGTFIEKIANTIHPPAQLGKLIEAGKNKLAGGHPKMALAISEKILMVKADSAAGLMLRGDALKALGQHMEAVLQYEAAVASSACYLGPIKRLADHYTEQNLPEKTLHYLAKLDTLSPLNYERKVDIGHTHLQLGQEEEADTAISRAIQIVEENDGKLLGDVAEHISTKCNEYPQTCEKHLRTIVKSDAGISLSAMMEAYNRLGIALRKQGKWQQAVQEYNKAIRRAPRDENLHFNKALALADGEQFKLAAQSLDTVLSLRDDFGVRKGSVMRSMGRIFQMAERYDDAFRCLEKALFFDPQNEELLEWIQETENALS